MDRRLVSANPISAKTLKNAGMEWLATGDNDDYIAPDFVVLSQRELNNFKDAASRLYDLMIRAAREAVYQNRLAELGIPPRAASLLKYSLERETGQHLVCRFDFAGGLDGVPLKMLELNADTCSLMPETAIVQDLHWEQEARSLPPGRPFNDLIGSLSKRLSHILRQYPGKTSTLLLSTFGYEEDWLNTEIISRAAKQAQFEDVVERLLEKVIFSPDEGFFIELNPEQFAPFDFWFKFVPWDILAFEEPELFDILDRIVRNGRGTALNPAFTMLLQSKGLMKIMHELEPYNPFLLKTSLTERDFSDRRYVRKPVFGRMGENIAYFDGGFSPEYETDGDYGNMLAVYQELAEFNADREGHRYQPSVFFTGEASALCFRRQVDLILDDDAEFIGHVVKNE